ncbi:hypothetical protein H312_03307 [Anncaliia algerae PRA339]|uniref:DUF5094 domain-containing protein n=1 Tax=Anncaliia algerae PRA339 TaxID=1288291 RepID=A0A059EWQ0_9MICR|nr:hypothetical protein H312_03307 [Anncaliia algerae PRA339]
MRKTPRKRVCFKTPKRKYNKPTKSISTVNKENNFSESEISKNLKEFSKSKKKEANLELEIAEAENKLVEAYMEENKMLRKLNSNALLFQKFYGIEIKEISPEIHEFSHKIDNKHIKFTLEEEADNYAYKLIDFFGIDLPSYLMERIAFKKKEIFKFFFKVFEIFLTKNVK